MTINLENVKLVIWDWYKTLSEAHLYNDLEETHPGAYEIIQNFFINQNEKINKWLKGDLTYKEIHQEFSKLTGLDTQVFDDSLKNLTGDIDERILKYIKKFQEKGIRQVIATDNFDVWDEFFLPQYSNYLSQYFVKTYNSAKFRLLKAEDNMRFIKHIIDDQKTPIENTLLLDDNDKLTEIFKESGGISLNYDNIDELENKLQQVF